MLSRYTTPEMKNIWSSSKQFRSDVKTFLNCKTTPLDVELTTFNLQLKYSLGLILRKIDRLKNALKKKAHEHKYTVCIGRTHGMHAEPTTFGVKMAQAYAEFCRHEQRLQHARDEACVVVFKDGRFDPEVEKTCHGSFGTWSRNLSNACLSIPDATRRVEGCGQLH